MLRRAAPPLLALALASPGLAAYNPQAPLLPDPAMTPGDVLTTDPAVICQPGYTRTVRDVPQALKEQVYREYGVTHREKGEYEIDHLISLELGGSNSVRNLWPESYQTRPLNAHVKDQIENRLHDLACAGKITFGQAQQAIARDWEAAYVQYLGPLPGGTVPTREGGSPRGPSGGPGGATAQGTGANAGAVPPNADGSCPAGAPVKVSRNHVFHLPGGDPSYDRTHAQSCFPSAAAAQAAGNRAPRG